MQDDFDMEVIKSRKYGRQLVVWNYEHSRKGKESEKRYNSSEKGRERQRRYSKTEKGKETEKRKSKKRIESGKNAERCRIYYQKKKMQKIIENL